MRFETKSYLLLFIVFLLGNISVFCSRNANNEELYNLLGVSKTATTKEIRVAFKKLALDKHPDKNKVSRLIILIKVFEVFALIFN